MRFVFLYEMFELGMYWRLLQSFRSSITISADSAGLFVTLIAFNFLFVNKKGTV